MRIARRRRARRSSTACAKARPSQNMPAACPAIERWACPRRRGPPRPGTPPGSRPLRSPARRARCRTARPAPSRRRAANPTTGQDASAEASGRARAGTPSDREHEQRPRVPPRSTNTIATTAAGTATRSRASRSELRRGGRCRPTGASPGRGPARGGARSAGAAAGRPEAGRVERDAGWHQRPPKRRRRAANSSRDSSNACREKSATARRGTRTPSMRPARAGSWRCAARRWSGSRDRDRACPGAYRCRRNSSSVVPVKLRAASTISARPP